MFDKKHLEYFSVFYQYNLTKNKIHLCESKCLQGIFTYSEISILQNTFSLMCHGTHSKAIWDEKVGDESVRDSASSQFYNCLRQIDLNAFCKTGRAKDQKT